MPANAFMPGFHRAQRLGSGRLSPLILAFPLPKVGRDPKISALSRSYFQYSSVGVPSHLKGCRKGGAAHCCPLISQMVVKSEVFLYLMYVLMNCHIPGRKITNCWTSSIAALCLVCRVLLLSEQPPPTPLRSVETMHKVVIPRSDM